MMQVSSFSKVLASLGVWGWSLHRSWWERFFLLRLLYSGGFSCDGKAFGAFQVVQWGCISSLPVFLESLAEYGQISSDLTSRFIQRSFIHCWHFSGRSVDGLPFKSAEWLVHSLRASGSTTCLRSCRVFSLRIQNGMSMVEKWCIGDRFDLTDIKVCSRTEKSEKESKLLYRSLLNYRKAYWGGDGIHDMEWKRWWYWDKEERKRERERVPILL